MQCDNKTCREYQEPVLNKETDDVYCSKCGGIIKYVSVFAKREMRASGQVYREFVQKQAFSIKCASCEKVMCPKLKEEDGQKAKLLCPLCDKEHLLSAPYAQTLIAFLKKAL